MNQTTGTCAILSKQFLLSLNPPPVAEWWSMKLIDGNEGGIKWTCSSVVEREAYTFVVLGSIPSTSTHLDSDRANHRLRSLYLRGPWFDPKRADTDLQFFRAMK